MPGSADFGPAALALGAGVTTLGVIRSLGRRGIPVAVPTPVDRLVSGSRWFTKPASTRPWDPDRPLSENLDALELESAVLFPCSDAFTLAVAELPEEATERFFSFIPSAEAVRTLLDKGAFLRALESLGIPRPRTHLIDCVEDLSVLPLQDPNRPLFIKPRDSQSFFSQTGVKGVRVRSSAELSERVHAFTEAGHRLILQEYVPGPASNHYFVDGFAAEGGRILTRLVRRRLRMYPTDFGNSTFMVTVPEEEAREAVDALQRLLLALRYRGIFSAEFKRDADDGTFRILEVNARPWWYIEFAMRAGMDVASMAYDAALGRKPTIPEGYQVGRKLVYPYYDLHACLETLPTRRAALWRFARDGFGADHAVFSWDDPWQGLGEWRRLVSGFVTARLSRGIRLRS